MESFYSDIILKQLNYNTFIVPCEKSKTVSFASSTMKNVLSFTSSPWFRFPVN